MQVLDCPVTPARGSLEAPAIENVEMAAAMANQFAFQQSASGLRASDPLHARMSARKSCVSRNPHDRSCSLHQGANGRNIDPQCQRNADHASTTDKAELQTNETTASIAPPNANSQGTSQKGGHFERNYRRNDSALPSMGFGKAGD